MSLFYIVKRNFVVSLAIQVALLIFQSMVEMEEEHSLRSVYYGIFL